MVYVLPVGDWVAGPVVRWAARLAQFVLYNGMEIAFVVGVGFVGIQVAEIWGARLRRMWVTWRETWGVGRRDDPLVNIGNLLTNMPDLPPGPMADAGLADLLSAPPGRRRTLKSRERWWSWHINFRESDFQDQKTQIKFSKFILISYCNSISCFFFFFQSIQISNSKLKNKMWNETSSKCRASAVKNLTINLHFLPSFIKSQKLLYYELCYFYFSSHINCKLLAHSAQSNLAVSIHIPISFLFRLSLWPYFRNLR